MWFIVSVTIKSSTKVVWLIKNEFLEVSSNHIDEIEYIITEFVSLLFNESHLVGMLSDERIVLYGNRQL